MPKWIGNYDDDEDYDYEKVQRIPQKPKIHVNTDEVPRQNSKKVKREKLERI